jgi:energy-coupling factor transporter ATP-binding protein EcfA2
VLQRLALMSTPALEVRDLYYHYPDGTEALRHLSFSISPGESVGLIGPNGAGKSTLLLHLNGILPDDPHATGDVLIDGQKISRRNLPTIRRKVSLLFQDPADQLFCPTIFDDIAFGPRQLNLSPADLQSVVKQSLSQVGLPGFEHRSTRHLSGGEKRRVCLAGLLACDPSLLVLDEPTASLDPRARRELKSLLKQLPTTKLIATHDLELVAELCSRTLLLHQGKIIADSPTHDLLSNEKLMLDHGLESPHILRHLHP